MKRFDVLRVNNPTTRFERAVNELIADLLEQAEAQGEPAAKAIAQLERLLALSPEDREALYRVVLTQGMPCPHCQHRMTPNGLTKQGYQIWRCRKPQGCGRTLRESGLKRGRPRMNPDRPLTSYEKVKRHRRKQARHRHQD